MLLGQSGNAEGPWRPLHSHLGETFLTIPKTETQQQVPSPGLSPEGQRGASPERLCSGASSQHPHHPSPVSRSQRRRDWGWSGSSELTGGRGGGESRNCGQREKINGQFSGIFGTTVEGLLARCWKCVSPGSTAPCCTQALPLGSSQPRGEDGKERLPVWQDGL